MVRIWKHGPSLALLALVLMAMSYAGLIIHIDFDRRVEATQTEVRAGLDDFVSATEAYFSTYEAVVSAIAETDCVRSRGKDGCGDLFTRLNQRFPQILNFAAISRDGYFFASGTPFPPKGPPNAANLGFFQELAKGGTSPYVMDPHRGPVSGARVTGLAVALRDAENRFDGVVGVSLRFEELEALWNRVRVGGDVGIVVFDRHGDLIFASSDAKSIADAGPAQQKNVLERLRAGEGAFALDRESFIFRTSSLAVKNWVVATVHPGPYALKDYLRDTSLLPRLLFPTLALAALAFLLSYRNWRNMFHLEEQVVSRTGELLQANAELKRANKDLAESVAELQTFMWVASHDLREPMRAVSTYVSLLEKRYGQHLDEDGHVFVGYARDGAKRMNDLVLDLLNYVHVGSIHGPMEQVFPGDMAKAALQALDGPISQCGAAVLLDLPSQPLFMCGEDMARILTNLTGNAIKFRHADRPPAIQVSSRSGPDGLVFMVEDNGIGIEPEYFEKIFVLFQRLDPARPDAGTGIGLTICRKIINRYGGRIWVESEPGAWARFMFTLPDAVSPDTSPAE